MNKLEVSIAGVTLKNPVIGASGTVNFGAEIAEYYDIGMLGGICTKGLTLEKRDGNPTPRIAETPSGMLNSVGLQNPGVDAFLAGEIDRITALSDVVIANVAGNTEEDYIAMCRKLAKSAVKMIELNISCPNVKAGGMSFGVDPKSVEKITKAVKPYCGSKPLIVKLTPNVAAIADNAKAAEAGGADAVSLINTLTGMAIDFKTKRPILANVTGGLSGPAVKPVALRMVWECYKAVKIPIIGMGGITTFSDVVEFMLAGAAAVQVGTANITTPAAMLEIVKGLENYANEEKISIASLTGALKI